MDVINERENIQRFFDNDYDKNGNLKKVRWHIVKKLMAYDFRDMFKQILLFLIAMLTFSIFASVYIFLCSKYPESFGIIITMILAIMFFVFSITASTIGVYVLGGKRFHKSFFSKEGYLVLSTPVSGCEHILAKHIVSYVFMLLVGIVMIVGLGIVLTTVFVCVVPKIEGGLPISQLPINANFVFLIIEGLITSLISPMASISVINSIVCFFSNKTRKQKGWIIFAGVFVYYVLSIIFSSMLPNLDLSVIQYMWQLHLMSIVNIVVLLAICYSCYLYETKFITKKINLQ